MAPGHNDPKLLYAIPGVCAYHLANGAEESLTPAGPQTLSLLMVPTASPFADASFGDAHGGGDAAGGSSADRAARVGAASSGAPDQEEDFYLHLHLPPELDLPLPATTQIYHQPPTSYLIPRWDLGRNSGVFTRLEFPAVGSRPGLQEDVDTFETILAQCTAFLERAPPPKTASQTNRAKQTPPPPPPRSAAATARAAAVAGTSGGGGGSGSRTSRSSSARPDHRDRDRDRDRDRRDYRDSKQARSTRASSVAPSEDLPAYNPADFKPGEAYAAGSHSSHAGGQLVLVDEEDGSVIGELNDMFQVIEDKTLRPGSKDPVEITLPTDAVPSISVAPASKENVEAQLHPAYRKSTLVSNAAAASRLIVATSEVVSRALQNQADNFAAKAVPSNKPITFQPSTHAHIRRINTISSGAAGLSAKAVGQVGKVAQTLGAKLAGHRSTGSVGSAADSSSGSGSGSMSKRTGMGPDGQPIDDFRPGLLNKSLMAFSTVADGVEQAGRHLMDSSSVAATTVVSSKWGSEAGEVTRHLTSGIKNVGLVYIDVTGVSRRAILKSVAKGMVVGHVPGGGDLIVGGEDGGATVVPAGGKDDKTAAPALPERRGDSGSRSGSGSGSGSSRSASVSRTKSTNDFAHNNPYRGK